jgi:hypothetical protein
MAGRGKKPLMLLKVGIFSNSVQRTIFLSNFCYLVTHAGTVNGSVQDESGYRKNWILATIILGRHDIINIGCYSFKINLQFERYLVDKPVKGTSLLENCDPFCCDKNLWSTDQCLNLNRHSETRFSLPIPKFFLVKFLVCPARNCFLVGKTNYRVSTIERSWI